MSSFKELGERELVRRIKDAIRIDSGMVPSDDAAVLGIGGGLAVSTDQVSFKRHIPSGMSYRQFGWYAAAVCFSDLAAMGARPVGFLSALSIDENMDEEDIIQIMVGIDECADSCGTYVIGGDTKPGCGMVTGTALGCMDGRLPLSRSGASPGDMVAVTGTLGNAAAGIHMLERGVGDAVRNVNMILPLPRLEEGIAMAEGNLATACMDLSDSLFTSLNIICEESNVGIEIMREFIPMGEDVEFASKSLNMDTLDFVARWGGDYELLFTFNPNNLEQLHALSMDFTIIGVVTDGPGAFIVDGEDRRRISDGIY